MKKVLLFLLPASILLVIVFNLAVIRSCSRTNPQISSEPNPDLLLLHVKGRIRAEGNGRIFLSREGILTEYMLEGPLTRELNQYANREVEVVGKVIAINPIALGLKTINAKIEVYAFGDNLITTGISAPLLELFQQKIEAKSMLRRQLIKKHGLKGTFDIAKGTLLKEARKVQGKGERDHITLITEDGDAFLLTGFAVKKLADNFKTLSAEPVVVTGTESMPDNGHTLRSGEMTFLVRDIYSASLEPVK